MGINRFQDSVCEVGAKSVTALSPLRQFYRADGGFAKSTGNIPAKLPILIDQKRAVIGRRSHFSWGSFTGSDALLY
jgi:hypothetical protein